MMTKEELLASLAELYGIEPRYYDVSGRLHTTSPDTQERLLTAMGCHCQSLEDLQEELRQRCQWPWSRLVEPVLALTQSHRPATWSCYVPLANGALPADLTVFWQLWDEQGSCRDQGQLRGALVVAATQACADITYGRLDVPLPAALEIGYYRLEVGVQAKGLDQQGQMLVIIAPPQVYTPEVLARQRLWGLQLQLYALASQRNWGIGDCADLQQLIKRAGELQLDIIGLNPLHHLGPSLEDSISPYYPTSRCFPEPLYLAMEQVPELADSPEAQAYLGNATVQAQLAAWRRSPQVNYPAVAQVKQTIIGACWTAFLAKHGEPEAPKTARGQEFARFVAQQGENLLSFATFLALAEQWQQQGLRYINWQDWPNAYHDPEGPAVSAWQREHRRDILKHAYAQWLLTGQLAATQQQAQQQGLAIGLYFDLAVGVNPGGFDTWRQQEIFAQGATIGAPPDDFSPLGQNWHLVPLTPLALRSQGYRYFREVLRHNCVPGGALRLDHVMGLFRLYWIPAGATAAQGAYVRYPAPELLKILAVESVRQQTTIIGEDLGTVEPSVRETLAKLGVFSTRLFYFERHEDGSCRPAEAYPDRALAAITTHDLPTLAGFWQGRDIQLREDLRLFPDTAAVDRAWAERLSSRQAILTLLRYHGLLSPETAAAVAGAEHLPLEVRWGVIAHLAATPCRFVLLSLEDIFGWLEQQNLPGTKNEYPNWRLKLPVLLEDILQAPELQQAADLMRQARRGHPRESLPLSHKG